MSPGLVLEITGEQLHAYAFFWFHCQEMSNEKVSEKETSLGYFSEKHLECIWVFLEQDIVFWILFLRN